MIESQDKTVDVLLTKDGEIKEFESLKANELNTMEQVVAIALQ